MTTHILTAPEKKGVTRWFFDPSSGEIEGGRYFNRKTGTWRDRGFKNWRTVFILVDVDEYGNKRHHHEFVLAPCDGYVHDLPTEKCYFEPGETIATFEEGYVYHWRFHDQKHKRSARVRAVICRKFPRVLYGLNLGIAALIGIVGYLLTLTGWEFPTSVGELMVLGSVPYTFFSGLLSLLGKERVHRFLKGWFDFKPFWHVFYGMIGLGFVYMIVYELLFGNGFSFIMLLWGLISFIAIDSMFAGAWNEGPFLRRYTKFLKQRVFKQKENGEDA